MHAFWGYVVILLVGAAYAEETCDSIIQCLVEDAGGNIWDFTKTFSNAQLEYSMKQNNTNITKTVVVQPCSYIRDYDTHSGAKRGYLWGRLDSISLGSMEDIDGDYEFHYLYGDAGYPCDIGSWESRRKAVVLMECGSCPKSMMQCHTKAGDNGCICGVKEVGDCKLEITMRVDRCPMVKHSGAANPTPNDWNWFTTLIFVLFIVMIIVCAGGYVYNYKVHDLRGLEALPGARSCSKCTSGEGGEKPHYMEADSGDEEEEDYKPREGYGAL